MPAIDAGEEAHNRRQAVRQARGDAVAAPDSERRQRVRHGRNLLDQRLISDADSGISEQKRGVPGWCDLDQFEKSVRLRHKYNLKPQARELELRHLFCNCKVMLDCIR